MPQQVSVIPAGALIEEASFNLGALASRNGVTVDGKSWAGSAQVDFGDNRKPAWPFLDFAIRPPGNVNVNLQYATHVPTAPVTEPPALTFTTFFTLAVTGGTWGTLERRLPARFSRIQVVDTSNAANNGIYIAHFIRGN